MKDAGRRGRLRVAPELLALALIATSCSPPPSRSPAVLDTVILPVPDAAFESPGISALRWSPDGAKLLVGQASGHLVVLGADGAPLVELGGDEAAWVDGETLAVRTDEPGRSDGPVSLVRLDDARLQPWPLVQGATGLLSGPAGVAVVIGDDIAGSWFRLLVGRTLGPQVMGRGEPVALSGDGRRLVVVHPGAPAATARLASTGSPEPGWIEVLAVPGLERVATFPDTPIEIRIPPVLDTTGRRIAAAGIRDEIVAFDAAAGTSRAVAGVFEPWGWLSTGDLVVSGQSSVAVIDVETAAVNKIADAGWPSAVSPGDLIAAATGTDGRSLLILQGVRALARAGFPAAIASLAWRPDGRVLAIKVRGDGPPDRLVLLPVPDLP